MTMLGPDPSPILLVSNFGERHDMPIKKGAILDLEISNIAFGGKGLMGLTTPDMEVFGVGGKGERAGGTGLCVWGLGEGVGLLPKRESSTFFWSEGTDSRLSMADNGGG